VDRTGEQDRTGQDSTAQHSA